MGKWQSRSGSQGRVLDGIPIYRAPFELAISLSPPHQLGKWLSGKRFAKPPVDGILAREIARAYVRDHADEIVLEVVQADSGNVEPLSALQTPPAPDSPRVDTVRKTVTVYLPGSQAVSSPYFKGRVLTAFSERGVNIPESAVTLTRHRASQTLGLVFTYWGATLEPGSALLKTRGGKGPRYGRDGTVLMPGVRGPAVEVGYSPGGFVRMLGNDLHRAIGRSAFAGYPQSEMESTVASELSRIKGNPAIRRHVGLLRRVRAELASLPVEGYVDAAIMVLQAWYAQRDAWAGRTVVVDGQQHRLSPGRNAVVLNPRELRFWVDPTETNDNWRKLLIRQLKMLAIVERRKDGRLLRFAENVVDGRDMADYRAFNPLAQELSSKQMDGSRYVFVELSRDIMNLLPMSTINAAGTATLWGEVALKEKLALTKHGYEERQKEKAKSKATASFFILPHHLAEAASRLTHQQRRLLWAVLGELRGPEDGWFTCAGMNGRGYKPLTWAQKAAYWPRPGAVRFTHVRDLAADIEVLNRWCGLEASYRGSPRDTAGAMRELHVLGGRGTEPSFRLLRFYLPADFLERVCVHVVPRPAEARLETATAIREKRARLGLTQAQLASHLRVSRTAVSHWETARYEPSTSALEWLASTEQ